MLAKMIAEKSEKIMESSYEEKSSAKGMAKAFVAGLIDGLSDGIIILGSVVMVASLVNKTKKK